MRKLAAICKRLRKRYGVQYAVIPLPGKRGAYRIYNYSFMVGDWFPVRTCTGVAECEDYLRSFERVKGGNDEN